jgi:hypothetical protein
LKAEAGGVAAPDLWKLREFGRRQETLCRPCSAAEEDLSRRISHFGKGHGRRIAHHPHRNPDPGWLLFKQRLANLQRE